MVLGEVEGRSVQLDEMLPFGRRMIITQHQQQRLSASSTLFHKQRFVLNVLSSNMCRKIDLVNLLKTDKF